MKYLEDSNEEEGVADAEYKAQPEMSEMDKMMTESPKTANTGPLAFVVEIVKVGLIALVIILPVRYFLIKPFYVNGASMEPTYYNREYLIIDEISYRFNLPQRGDVIVFRYPEDRSQFFIKRIIGLPGERVVIKNGDVMIYNDENTDAMVLREPYLSDDTKTVIDTDATMAADEYFVLGDNRNESLDSRRFGKLNKKDIIGRTWLRGWPIDRIGILSHYKYDF